MQEQQRQREDQKQPPFMAPAKLAQGERELTTGLLSKNASFRLIVSGDVGVKEIERLIAKLELDKEILGESDRPAAATPAASETPGAHVSFFVTKAQKAQLQERGYTEDQIAKMKPAEAHKILGIGA